MKDILIIIGALLAAGIVVTMVMLAARSFSSAVTPTDIINPKPGVSCVKLVTADGVAVSCWKD